MKQKRKLRKPFIAAIIIGFGLLASLIGTAAVNFVSESKKVDAVQFIVDGQVWFTYDNKTVLTSMLDTYKQSFIRNIDSNATILGVDFVQTIEMVDVRVEKEELISIYAAEKKIREIEVPATIYEVVKGDNLWDIAIANKMPLSQIIKYNPDLNPEKIWPGDEILFVPENPMLDVMVRLENKTFEPVEYRTEYVQDPTLLTSQRIILKPGKEGVKRVTYDITMLNGYENEVIIDQETELIAPVSAKVKVGTKRTLTRISNSNFGVTSGRLSSNFGYRTHPISGKRTFHAGIDIAASTGTAVYAYSEGTVSAAGFNNTYGKYVIINHGGGLQTLYLHLSSINVDTGDKVATGKRIGNVGNTGYSTGSHLHFEVRVNGVAKSPWNYI